MKRIALFLVTLLCLSACGSKQQQSGKETLTVTLEPLRYFTEVIAGDKYNVVSMVPKGSSPRLTTLLRNSWSIWTKVLPTYASVTLDSNKHGWIN